MRLSTSLNLPHAMANLSRKIVVCGATGRQGGALITHLLEDETFSIRAITRKPDSERAKVLIAQGVEVVKADFDDPDSLVSAFTGCYGVFGNTNYFEAGSRTEQQGRNMVDAAIACDIKHFVWSTAPDADQVPTFRPRAAVAKYLKTTVLPYTLVYPVCYYDNFFLMLHDKSPGKFDQSLIYPSDKPMPAMNPDDFGAWVLAAFLNPKEWIGKDIRACSDWWTLRDVAHIYASVAKTDVKLREVTLQDFLDKENDPKYPQGLWPGLKFYLDNYSPDAWDPELSVKLHPNGTTWEAYVMEKLQVPIVSSTQGLAIRIDVSEDTEVHASEDLPQAWALTVQDADSVQGGWIGGDGAQGNPLQRVSPGLRP